MMNVRNLAAIAGLLSISVVVFAQTGRRDGRWEVTTTMEMPGMPAGMPPVMMTQCITKEQAADPQKAFAQVPQRGNQQNDCKVSDFKSSGNKLTYTVKCTTPQEMSADVEMNYGNDTYDGVMKMSMSRGGQTMDMTMKMAAKRLGDCTQ